MQGSVLVDQLEQLKVRRTQVSDDRETKTSVSQANRGRKRVRVGVSQSAGADSA